MTFHHTPRRLRVFSASVILWAILARFFGATAQETTPAHAPELKPGETIERELASGQTHDYKLTLRSGQYVNIGVEQFEVNVEVVFVDPKGTQITNIDWWWREGTESFWAAAESAGDYILKLSAPTHPVETGKYRVTVKNIHEWQDATPSDQSSVKAFQNFAEGKRLFAQSTAESIGKAKERFQEALQLWRSLQDTDAEAHTLNELGVIEYRGGDLKQAAEYLTQAIKLFRERKNYRGETDSTSTLGIVYNFSGEPHKALESYNEALVLARSIKDRLSEAQILSGLGLVLHRLGQTQKALETLNELVAMSRATGMIDGEASGHNNIGFIYIGQGRMRDAIQEYSQTLSLLQRSQDRFGEAATINNIGSAYARMGEYQQALSFLLQGLRLRKTLGDRRGESANLGSIGYLYLRLGEYSKAIQYYERSLELSRTIRSRDNEAIALLNLGTIYGRTRELQKALDHASQALLLVVELKDRNGEANVLTTLGSIHNQLGNLPKALEYYEKALTLRRTGENKYGESYTLSALGTVYAQMGNQQRALEYLNQALALSRSVSDRFGEVAVLYELARAKRRSRSFIEARAEIESALKVIESDRAKISLADVRANYFASRQDYYDFYIDLLMQLYKVEKNPELLAAAFLANERRTARNLLDGLAEAKANIRAGVPSELINRELRLQQDLSAKADQQARLLSRKHTPEQATALGREIEKLTSEYEQALAQIRQASPRYAALTQPSPAGLRQIQEEVLDPDSLLLEYTLGEERSYLWAVTDKSITTYELPKRSEIETETRRVHDLMVNKADALQPEVLSRLSQTLLGPVAGQLGRKRLVIVAQGSLQYLSFGALPTPSSPEHSARANRQGARRATGEPLLANHEIVSLPSTSVMAELRRDLSKRKRAARRVIVLADPVFGQDDPRIKGQVKTSSTEPTDKNATADESVSDVVRAANDVNLVRFDRLSLSRREAQLITAGVPKDQFLQALDFSASRAAATNPEVGQYQIVHFATHSLINNRHPELSGIVLSLVDEQGKPQDGFLRLHEIYNLKLGADLVVLSACQTALGKDIRGEGLIGLTRGFMYAGAPRVVATLWKVSDSATSELMSRFYQNMLRKGLSPAASLRAAQLSMRREKQWAAPYYWAGFVLQGEWQ